MEKNEVTYNGVVVGYSYDGKTVEFLNTKEINNLKDKIFNGKPIGISARKMGYIDENGNISEIGE